MVPEFSFVRRARELIVANQTVLGLGCDPWVDQLPRPLLEIFCRQYGHTDQAIAHAMVQFCVENIDAVVGLVYCIKPQSAFFEQYGHWGIWAKEQIISHAKKRDFLVILDAKRGDGGLTAEAYGRAYLGQVHYGFDAATGRPIYKPSPSRVDALTMQVYIGSDCVNHFVTAAAPEGTMPIAVIKTSFKTDKVPCSEVEALRTEDGTRVWQETAKLCEAWAGYLPLESGYRNFGIVIGATFPDDAEVMKRLVPWAWKLIPGFGSQGGGADDAVVSMDADGFGGVVNSARDLALAFSNPKRKEFNGPPENWAECCHRAAVHDRKALNDALRRAGKGLGWLPAE